MINIKKNIINNLYKFTKKFKNYFNFRYSKLITHTNLPQTNVAARLVDGTVACYIAIPQTNGTVASDGLVQFRSPKMIFLRSFDTF